MSEKKQSTKFEDTRKLVSIIIVVVIVILLAFYLIEGPSAGFSLQQFIGIILAAALSGAVTLLLLRGQNDVLEQQRVSEAEIAAAKAKGEAEKDKDVKIYSSKIMAFSLFNKAVWQNDLDTTDSAVFVKTLDTIRKELFGKVLLYLDSTEIDEIVDIVKKRGEGRDLPRILSSIVSILNNNADRTLSEGAETKGDDDAFSQSCQKLWDEFSNWIHSYDSVPEEEVQETEKNEVETVEEKPWTFNAQAWHFCMLSSLQTDQMKKNNLYELSLVEYGQTWRTGLVKQVKPGDIVFLFRGSKRYLGVYKAIGWRVLYYSKDEQGLEYVREEVSEGIQKKVVLEGDTALMWDNAVNERLKQYDFYCSFGDGATSCANVVVEELSFVPDGVVTPNTTYRPTISRYYWVYAGKLLKVFLDADPQARTRFDKLMPGFLKENNL